MPFFALPPSIPNLQEDFDRFWDIDEIFFYYSLISPVEMKFIMNRAVKKGASEDDLEKEFSIGLDFLKSASQPQAISYLDPEINNCAYSLRKKGHTDYFDCVIATSAVNYCDVLLTEDGILPKNMQKLFETSDYSKIEVLDWKKFQKRF